MEWKLREKIQGRAFPEAEYQQFTYYALSSLKSPMGRTGEHFLCIRKPNLRLVVLDSSAWLAVFGKFPARKRERACGRCPAIWAVP